MPSSTVLTLCGSCKNRRSSETSVLTRATQRNIPEDGTLHYHRREKPKISQGKYTSEAKISSFLFKLFT
jgi:hypothetical protein